MGPYGIMGAGMQQPSRIDEEGNREHPTSLLPPSPENMGSLLNQQ